MGGRARRARRARPFACVCAEGGSRPRLHRHLARRLSRRTRRERVLVRRASARGEARPAQGIEPDDAHVLRGREGDVELSRDGNCEGGARSVRSLPRRRARAGRDPCQRDLSRAGADARCAWREWLQADVQIVPGDRATPVDDHDRRRRPDRRVLSERAVECGHRRGDLRRRRLQHPRRGVSGVATPVGRPACRRAARPFRSARLPPARARLGPSGLPCPSSGRGASPRRCRGGRRTRGTRDR